MGFSFFIRNPAFPDCIISERVKAGPVFRRVPHMDNGASSYRRFLDGDENGIVQIIKEYKDGLILYLNGFVRNVHTAEEIAEETFVKLVAKKAEVLQKQRF